LTPPAGRLGKIEGLVMSLLARVKIITKILAVILLLGAVAIGISWLGIRAMSSMNDDAETMTSAAKRALEAARASTSVMSLSSAEFQVALDPRPENRATVRKIVDEQMKLI
jgi:methyl-accepting chemotaxis protein